MKRIVTLLLILALLGGLLCLLAGCYPQISKQEAEKIAVEAFGYNTSQVTFTYCKRNSINSMNYFTVVYEVDGYEFNVGIDAETGKVLVQNSNPVGTTQNTAVGIG